MIKSLIGLYGNYKGEILVNGKSMRDIRNITKKIGIIPQDNFLFSDTIFNNIKIGNLNKKDEELFTLIEKIKFNDDLRLKVTIDFDELLNLRIYEKNKLLFLIGSREIKKGQGRKISYFEFRFKHNMKLYFIEIGSSMVRIGPISYGILGVSHKKNKNKKDKKK